MTLDSAGQVLVPDVFGEMMLRAVDLLGEVADWAPMTVVRCLTVGLQLQQAAPSDAAVE